MLDSGMVGEPALIRRRLSQLGMGPKSIRGILLTHGHLDHAGNLAWLKEWTGAPVYGHPAEQLHLDGRDLLVRVKAVSVNPVDIKGRAPKDKVETEPKILGWDRGDSLPEAIAMAKSAVGPSPDITMMHHPPIVMADME